MLHSILKYITIFESKLIAFKQTHMDYLALKSAFAKERQKSNM